MSAMILWEGGAGDGTYLLKHIMDNGLRSAGVSTIRDPEIVQAVVKAGVGGRVKGILGGKTDEFHGEPVAIDAKVLGIKSDMIPREYYDLDTLQDVGNIAILDHDGIIIVVTEPRCNIENIVIFNYLDVDIDVANMKVILMKGSGEAYKCTYKELAAGFITPQSYGLTNPDITRIGDYSKVRRPDIPFDKNVKLHYK